HPAPHPGMHAPQGRPGHSPHVGHTPHPGHPSHPGHAPKGPITPGRSPHSTGAPTRPNVEAPVVRHHPWHHHHHHHHHHWHRHWHHGHWYWWPHIDINVVGSPGGAVSIYQNPYVLPVVVPAPVDYSQPIPPAIAPDAMTREQLAAQEESLRLFARA